MKQTIKSNGKALSIPAGLAYGAAISFGITVLGAALTATLLDREILQWEQCGYMIMAVLLIGALAGSASACAKVKRQRLAVSMLSGLVYWLSLLAVTALFFGGQYRAVAVTAGLILAGCGCTLLLGGGRKKGRRAAKVRIGRG